MSERSGGGGTPGNPPRIPGLPSNAAFHEIAEFRTLNAQRPRPSIQDQEMAWCQNLMPIGAYYLRALPDKSSIIYGSPPPPFESFAVALGPGSGLPIAFDINSVANGRIVVPRSTVSPYGSPIPLIVDNQCTVGAVGPMTTVAPGELIVVFVSAKNPTGFATPQVTSIIGAGLTFMNRFRQVETMTTSFDNYSPTIETDHEIWWAVAPAVLTNATFTVTFNVAVEAAVCGAVAIENANLNDPWDTTTALGVNIHNDFGPNSTIQTSPLSTSAANDLVISWFVQFANSLWQYAYPSPWGFELKTPFSGANWENSAYAATDNPSVNVGTYLNAVGYYNIYTSPQSGVTPYGLTSGASAATWFGVADAIKGYPIGPGGHPAFLQNSNLGFPTSASTFLYVGWVTMASTGAFNLIFDTEASSGVQIVLQFVSSQWQITVQAFDAEDGLAITAGINTGVNFVTNYHSIAISVDTATSTIQWMIDSHIVSTAGLFNGFPIATNPGDTWRIGGNQSAEIDLGQMWFAIGQPFFDLTVEENVDRLFGDANCVQNWGVRGELITGLSPQVFLYGPHGRYPTNFGSGGPWDVSGTFFDAFPAPTACVP